jgi:pyridinium-3,5-biscarboxylic acid mononucleotide sulfurtransferase
MSELLDRLSARLAQESTIVTAYSGGVDSALLAVVAHRVLGRRALAVTAVSASLPARARTAAREFAAEQGFRHVEVCTDELDRPAYVRNGGDRCAHCKTALFDQLDPIAGLLGARIALAANTDDLSDHRPGQGVAARRGAIMPLLDTGFSKADVRAVSRELGLRTHDRPAEACLSSRVAFGDPVTADALRAIERAEDALHELGFGECRVRAHGQGTVARVEVPATEIDRLVALRQHVVKLVREAGFTYVTLDLDGLRRGSMNALLPAVVTLERPVRRAPDRPVGAA